MLLSSVKNITIDICWAWTKDLWNLCQKKTKMTF